MRQLPGKTQKATLRKGIGFLNPARLQLSLRAMCLGLLVATSTPAAEAPARPWTPALLHDINVWLHSENDARVAVTPRGLRAEVASGRKFAIGAASQLELPKNLGRICVTVAETGNGAKWFVRLYGALPDPDEHRTLALA